LLSPSLLAPSLVSPDIETRKTSKSREIVSWAVFKLSEPFFPVHRYSSCSLLADRRYEDLEPVSVLPLIYFHGRPITALAARLAATCLPIQFENLAFSNPLPQHALHGLRFGVKMTGKIAKCDALVFHQVFFDFGQYHASLHGPRCSYPFQA
jgi:hypothetical protein